MTVPTTQSQWAAKSFVVTKYNVYKLEVDNKGPINTNLCVIVRDTGMGTPKCADGVEKSLP